MKLRIWVKIILFISSYFPLLFIFAFQYWKFYHHSISLFCISLAVLSCGITLLLINDSKKLQAKTFFIESINDQSDLSLNYLYTYIIPFLTFSYNDWVSIFSVSIFIVITAIIYINSNLLYINPFLNIMGYSMFKIKTSKDSRKVDLIIIAENKNNHVNIGDKIHLTPINHNIYLLDKLL